jgi:ferric-dicitrate binding protein FerR (iron transport regulator)
MSDKSKTEELLQLSARLCDQTISVAEREQLERLLVDHPELRADHLTYVRLHGDLMWRYRSSADTEINSPLTVPTPLKTGPTSFGWAGLSLAMAALLLAVFGSATWAWIQSRSDEAERAPIAAVAAEPFSSNGRFVATLRDATGAVWLQSEQPVDVGQRIGTGTLRIDSGDAELIFDSGARLILSAPVKLRIDSPLSVYLESGMVAAHVPPSAIGFRIGTASAEYVDQGTEFGVVAEPDGASEVHVFRGQVDVVSQHKTDSTPLALIGQEAFRSDQSGGWSGRVEFAASLFGALPARVAEPVQWRVADGGNGHWYQLVVTDQPINWHDAALRTISMYHQGMRGHLLAIASSSEDQFVVEQVIQELAPQRIWIGLTDVLQESHFQWVTGDSVGYSNWRAKPVQQPDDFHEADWHGGEDYGVYVKIDGDESWHWNDMSVDSINYTVSAFLVEYEPPSPAFDNSRLSLDPLQWPSSDGGNDHFYQLVLSHVSLTWDQVQRIAEQSEFEGRAGRLVALETKQEREFVCDRLLQVCGITEHMVGLSGSGSGVLRWNSGVAVADGELVSPPPQTSSDLALSSLCGVLTWNAHSQNWELKTRPVTARPSGGFGFIVEYNGR